MRLRRPMSAAPSRIDINMTPMIDAVFLLLIFFMLTLRILAPEGDLVVNRHSAERGPANLIEGLSLRVRCEANPDGSLAQLFFGNRPLGSKAPECYQQLSDELFAFAHPGLDFAPAVQLEADPALAYEHTLKALSACTGRLNPATGRIERCSESVTLIARRD